MTRASLRQTSLPRTSRAAIAAAGLLTLAGAGEGQAQQLSPGKSRPTFLATCPDAGKGFFKVPGTDTCLAVGGSVETDFYAQGPVSRAIPVTGSNIIGRIAFDSVTQTDFGTLRAFMRLPFSRNSLQGQNTSFEPDYLIISMSDSDAGWTAEAGRTDSIANFYASALNVLTLRGPNVTSNLFKYQVVPDSGFAWFVSLEDTPANVRGSRINPDVLATAQPGQVIPDGLPRAAATLQYNADWGQAQISGLIGRLRLEAPNATLPRLTLLAGLNWSLSGGGSKKGNGDQLWVQGAVTSGDTTYLGFSSTIVNGKMALSLLDGVRSQAGDAKATTGAALTAAYSHVINPRWTANAFGSWATVRTARPVGLYPDVLPFNEWRIGANVVYTPVDNFTVTAEAMWIDLAASRAKTVTTSVFPEAKDATSLQFVLQAKRVF